MASSVGEMESGICTPVEHRETAQTRIRAERESKSRLTGLRRVATGLYRFRHPIGNLYFVVDSQSAAWVIVDAGLSVCARKIIETAQRTFTSSPAAIVLTHGHFDHVGALPELLDWWPNVVVYAHPLEFPYLKGLSSYPPMDPVAGRGMVACMSRFFPRGPINLGGKLLELPPDGSVPYLTEWKWIHCPGHTPGHVAFFRETDRSLIAGDAFVTARPESALALFDLPHNVYNPPAYATTDWPAAFRSVNVLARLEPEVAATGHGVPLYGESLRRDLEKLGESVDGFVPSRGRYVKEPVMADALGVRHVPPPVLDVKPIIYSAIGVAALAAGLYWRAKRQAVVPSRLQVAKRSLAKWVKQIT